MKKFFALLLIAAVCGFNASCNSDGCFDAGKMDSTRASIQIPYTELYRPPGMTFFCPKEEEVYVIRSMQELLPYVKGNVLPRVDYTKYSVLLVMIVKTHAIQKVDKELYFDGTVLTYRMKVYTTTKMVRDIRHEAILVPRLDPSIEVEPIIEHEVIIN